MRDERIWATAKDGVQVPISLVCLRGYGAERKGPLALRLRRVRHQCGTGLQQRTAEPCWTAVSSSASPCAGRRGAGARLVRERRMENKVNTFTDFIACAEQLVADGHADPKRLYRMGGSAGGLLVGQ
ncbi:MAG: prolyl oligopeptidase family serine peptidase [Flavobacteriales bacterium]|nr:prolyl oligopeptidase family serine peptidase [Flavobacteriales bacterium]